jgi:hypothetical protein
VKSPGKYPLILSVFAAAVMICTAAQMGYAQPGNDDVCSATALPVDGTCVSAQTNLAATADAYVGPACCQQSNLTVWYSFTLTGANNSIDITFTVPGTLGGPPLGNGNTIETFVYQKNNCTGSAPVTTNCGLASQTFSFGTPNNPLVPGLNYYLMIGTVAGDAGNFDLCAIELVAPTGNQTGPEQDCIASTPVCNAVETSIGSYLGYGDEQEVSGSSCLLNGENNSSWYVFTVQSSGTFGFTLATTKDYDFALYDITNTGCAGIPSATPVRCNFSGTLGNTGLTVPGSTKSVNLSEGGMGTPTMDGISDMVAGETYALIIDNWTGDNSGFSLTWSGTASVVDGTGPTMSSAASGCSDNTFSLTMAEDIQCGSIVQGDFILTLLPSTVVTSAITNVAGESCTGNGQLTNKIIFTHDGSLTSGTYELEIATNPTLADKCGNTITAGSTITFDHLAAISISASATETCSPGTAVTLTANGGPASGATYSWAPSVTSGGTTAVATAGPNTTTMYSVYVTYGGCTNTDNETVTVVDNVITVINPVDPQICSGTTTLSATTTVNGTACVGCTYVWSTTATTTAITVGAGTYDVTTTTSGTCAGDNVPTSTVSLASGGSSGTCSVYYVQASGGCSSGATCGLEKTNPATLVYAITQAECTSSIIKLSIGIYSLTDFQLLKDYVTLEGGYNSGFTTKTSDLSGGANSTTVRRSNAADSDDANTCTAFRIQASADDWRIQDVRIELPGSTNVTAHANSTEVTNYGIRIIGVGSTGYNIVRCYIDAGVGSNP